MVNKDVRTEYPKTCYLSVVLNSHSGHMVGAEVTHIFRKDDPPRFPGIHAPALGRKR